MPDFSEYFPFDKGYGATANAARWSKMGQFFLPDGVLNWNKGLAGLGATLTAGSITIQPGAVWVHGYYAELQVAEVIAVGNTGTVVAGVDLTSQKMSLYYNDGSLGYNACTQDATVWEIPLWGVSAGKLIDFRSNTSQGRGNATTINNYGTWYPINPGVSTYFPLGVSEITHPCLVMLNAMVEFQSNDARYPQNAIYSIVYNSGLPDAAQSWGIEPFYFPGGGVNATVYRATSTLPYAMWVSTPGKKTWGIQVTCGTGAFPINVANMFLNILQTGSISNA